MEYNSQDVPIDPFYVGLWLGDGHSRIAGAITTIDQPIIDYIYDFAKLHNIGVRHNDMTYFLSAGNDHRNNPFKIQKIFKSMNLIKNKHIPDIYLRNTFEVRSKVLAGLIDSDGYYETGRWEITQKNERLANDIVILARSLGFFTTVAESWKACTNSFDPLKKEIYHRIYISIVKTSVIIPVLLERKRFIGGKFTNNPKLWFGDTIKKRIEWTDILDTILLREIKKYEGRTNIEWMKIIESTPEFKNNSSEGLRTRYRDLQKRRLNP